MPKVGIIANPYSKLNKRNPKRLALMKQIVGSQGNFIVTRSIKELHSQIKQLSSSHYDLIAICGGDGTISQTLSCIIKYYPENRLPKVAVLKGGTMNLIASQLKINGGQIRIVKRFVKGLSKNKKFQTKSLNSLEVDGNIGFLYADGSAVRILKEFYRKKSGVIGAAWLALRLVGSFIFKGPLIKKMIVSQGVNLDTGSKNTELSTIGGFAGTITKLPLGFPLLPMAQKKKGHFQANFITCSPEKLLWQLPSIMLKHSRSESSKKFSICCREAKLSSEETIHYTLDGELFESNKPLRLKLGPKVDFVKL